MTRRCALFLLCLCLPALCAFTVRYQGYGFAPATGERFLADLDHDLAVGVAAMNARTEAGVTCSGRSRVIHIPKGIGCAGQQGDAALLCSDGRDFEFLWQARSCISGFGAGFDSTGEAFYFVFGGDPATLEERARAVPFMIEMQRGGANVYSERGDRPFLPPES